MYVKAILKLIADGKYPDPPNDLKGQLREAEDQATMLRTLVFHIRREWYRKSTKTWMAAFPRPTGTMAVADSLPAAEEAPSTPAARRRRRPACEDNFTYAEEDRALHYPLKYERHAQLHD